MKKRDDIIIKPVDKGGAVVVWRRDLYIKEVEHQLQNGKFYLPITAKTTVSDNKVVRQIITIAINEGQLPSHASSLVVTEPKEPRFYILPKILKPDTPGHPIVSACSCPTHRLYPPALGPCSSHICKKYKPCPLPLGSLHLP